MKSFTNPSRSAFSGLLLRDLNRKLFAAGVSDELARLLLNIPAVVLIVIVVIVKDLVVVIIVIVKDLAVVIVVIVKDLAVKSHLVVQELSYTVLHSSGPSPTQTFWSNVLKQSTLFLKFCLYFLLHFEKLDLWQIKDFTFSMGR